MSYQVTNIFTRPSTAVNFHVANIQDSYIQYVLQNYKNTNKIIDLSSDISEDGLTLTAVWTWTTQAEYDAFQQDAITVQQRAERDAWNQANNIAMTQTAVEV
jgi:hypothetical protein